MRYKRKMRTALAIDDDGLMAAKAMARQQGRSIGDVLADLARLALHRREPPKERNGVILLPRGDRQAVVTLEAVNALRDE